MHEAIPIQNIYYLLAYAWDWFPEDDISEITAQRCPDAVNLFARVIAKGISHATRRGLQRDYLKRRAETSVLRGRIDFNASAKRLTAWRASVVCEFEELSYNILSNRIIKSSLKRLLADPSLQPENRKELLKCRKLLGSVEEVRVTSQMFRRVQYHRNNRFYRFLLSVCELIHESLLPEESPGTFRFRDFRRDDKIMHRLFQRFVLNFARRKCTDARVRSMCIEWSGHSETEAARAVLPRMITDVAIEWENRKVILDCKYYRKALVENLETLRLHSTHLYQIYAYMSNQAAHSGWEECEGILLTLRRRIRSIICI